LLFLTTIIYFIGCSKEKEDKKVETIISVLDMKMPRKFKRTIDSITTLSQNKDYITLKHCMKILSGDLADLKAIKVGEAKVEIEKRLVQILSLLNSVEHGVDIKPQWQNTKKNLESLFNGVESESLKEKYTESEAVEYKNDELGFTIWTPNWLSNRTQQQVGKSISINFSDQEFQPNYLLTIKVTDKPRYSNLTVAFEDYRNQLKSRLKVEIDANGFSTVDSLPAYWLDMTSPGQTEDQNAIMRQYYLIHKQKIYVVGYGARNIEHFNEVMERYEQVIESLIIH
jgi:hypothetical protein